MERKMGGRNESGMEVANHVEKRNGWKVMSA